MSSRQKTHLNMRQLNKLESIIYLAGGIIMVAGAGLYAFLMLQPFACWLMLVGAIAFVLVQARQRYLGTQLVVRRLRRIMPLADGYSSYVSIFHHNWVILLLLSSVIEMYTTHRISYELKKESDKESN